MAKKRGKTPDASPPPPASGGGSPAPAGEKAKKPESALKAGMDFVLVLAGAVAIALVIKAYLFDVYVIPSGSMETALRGRPDGGDRIFCSKISYRFRQLRRWEVAVFEFPYEAAKRSATREEEADIERYRGQNFVKRMVGLPGETLAVARGDIWVKRDGESEYRRLVKPDSVQQGMWLNVYEEDFSDLSLKELQESWSLRGGAARLDKGGPLRLDPGGETAALAYRPRVPAGARKDAVAELPGIPDRYTLRQPVQFRCSAIREDGSPCATVFVKTVHTHNIHGRCPSCGSLEPETSAIFYHRRSGLPTWGRYAVNPDYARQGEDSIRQTDYRFVPDLRVALDATLSGADSWLGVRIWEDNRNAEARFHADGRVELLVNGGASLPEHRALADIAPGKRETLEFYVVDGRARAFVGKERKPFLDVQVWNDRQPPVRSLPRASGVVLTAGGAGGSASKVKIDRDVFYFSGRERPEDAKFGRAMGARGEIRINGESFFPMGDHCDSSYDARSWGAAPLANLRGPALLVWWPPDRIGLIPKPD
ncbi:MAG: signal peptidase I [Planctomycetota bacterium]|jgi:signal peptidase I|nr:signal peptidase I [Planctomycetota bacterium]